MLTTPKVKMLLLSMLMSGCHLPRVGDLPLYKSVTGDCVSVALLARTEVGFSGEFTMQLTNPNEEPFPMSKHKVRVVTEGAETFEWEWYGGGAVSAGSQVSLAVPFAFAYPADAPLDGSWTVYYEVTYKPEGALRETLRESGLPAPSTIIRETGQWSEVLFYD